MKLIKLLQTSVVFNEVEFKGIIDKKKSPPPLKEMNVRIATVLFKPLFQQLQGVPINMGIKRHDIKIVTQFPCLLGHPV